MASSTTRPGRRISLPSPICARLRLAQRGVKERCYGRARRRVWQTRGSPPRGRAGERLLLAAINNSGGRRILAIPDGQKQQRLPLGRQLFYHAGQHGGHLGAGHFAGRCQAQLEEILVRRAHQSQQKVHRARLAA